MDARQIGKRIQRIRKQRGLTQEQLSQMVNLSTNYLSNIETGFKTPKLETLVAIMNALECDANTLLSDVVTVTSLDESRQITPALADLPPREQQRIKRVVEVLIDEAKK